MSGSPAQSDREAVVGAVLYPYGALLVLLIVVLLLFAQTFYSMAETWLSSLRLSHINQALIGKIKAP